jgi:hypothetical protein
LRPLRKALEKSVIQGAEMYKDVALIYRLGLLAATFTLLWIPCTWLLFFLEKSLFQDNVWIIWALTVIWLISIPEWILCAKKCYPKQKEISEETKKSLHM